LRLTRQVRRAGSEGLRRRSTSLEGGGAAEHDPSMQTFTAAMPEPGLEAEGGCGLDGALSLPCLGRAPGGAECLSAADVGALCHSGASLCCSWQVNPRSPGPPALRTSAVQQGTCDTALAACCKPARSWQ